MAKQPEPQTDAAKLYRATITTDNGDISDSVRTNPDSDRSILAETDNGDATVRYGS